MTDAFYYLFINTPIILSTSGFSNFIMKSATGPTKKAQITVPIPTEPPSSQPIKIKRRSVIILITPNFL